MRFEPEIVDLLLGSQWWEMDPDDIWARLGPSLYSRNIRGVLELLKGEAREVHQAQQPLNVLELNPDLSNSAEMLRDVCPAELLELFLPPRKPPLPAWPNPEQQMRYTGRYGLELMEFTKAFVDLLDRDGAFEKPGWRGLDFGCGWGRIASYMLTRGSPAQLDLCDAWASSLALLDGFQNRRWLVAEILKSTDVPAGSYDFVLAFSILSHLNRKAFNAALTILTSALRPDGKLYFTVWHDEALRAENNKGRFPQDAACDPSGFWSSSQEDGPVFGNTIVTTAFLVDQCQSIGKLMYIAPIGGQHLYAVCPIKK
jgi:SAM-dependent methyltransferase